MTPKPHPDLIPCSGCGDPSTTVYCLACARVARCPHGCIIGDCHDCDVAADLAFDGHREGNA